MFKKKFLEKNKNQKINNKKKKEKENDDKEEECDHLKSE